MYYYATIESNNPERLGNKVLRTVGRFILEAEDDFLLHCFSRALIDSKDTVYLQWCECDPEADEPLKNAFSIATDAVMMAMEKQGFMFDSLHKPKIVSAGGQEAPRTYSQKEFDAGMYSGWRRGLQDGLQALQECLDTPSSIDLYAMGWTKEPAKVRTFHLPATEKESDPGQLDGGPLYRAYRSGSWYDRPCETEGPPESFIQRGTPCEDVPVKNPGFLPEFQSQEHVLVSGTLPGVIANVQFCEGSDDDQDNPNPYYLYTVYPEKMGGHLFVKESDIIHQYWPSCDKPWATTSQPYVPNFIGNRSSECCCKPAPKGE